MKRLCVMITLMAALVPGLHSDFISGSQTCPSSGNKQLTTTSQNLYQLVVTANILNSAEVHVGGNNTTTSNGGVLTPGASFSATKTNPGVNPTTLYIACVNSGDSVTWVGSR
jgi:hypothetical protein